MNTIIYQKNIPVTDHFDVIVCGGGAAGIGAALAAAEKGAKTALIERFGFLGGMATAGYVNPMSEFAYNGRQVVGGIAWRFAQKLVKNGGGLVEAPRCNVSFNPEIYKLTAQQLLEEANVTCFMNTNLIDCATENDAITSVIAANKSGLFALSADYFIDCTGDADLCALAGVEMLPQVEAMQPGTLCFTLSGVDTSTERMHIIHQKNHRFNHQATFVREPLLKLREEGVDVPQFGGPWLATTMIDGCITVNMTRSAMNATDSADYQRAEAKMRKDVFRLVALMREHVEEFKNCQLSSIATVAGIRESRRIRGVHILTGKEYVVAHKYHDAIARSAHAVDIHLPGNDGQKLIFPEDAGYIPYRSLITPTHKNLLAAGRCISADGEAFAAIRVQAPCMETGQAAGFAAAMCLADKRPVQNVDTDALVAQVRAAGSFV
jgi:hypothetical protein